ncbi:MAG: ComEC/Rec2 family competence protein [Bacteroidales bacterium]|nr:ComEC/Rec2 family competence protein [Bacteroidales bacterium]MDY2705120.1 ComEC/Rec2 family competence protein [Alloprevotella sp.]
MQHFRELLTRWIRLNPLYRVVVPLGVGLVVGEYSPQPYCGFSPWSWWCILLVFLCVSGLLLLSVRRPQQSARVPFSFLLAIPAICLGVLLIGHQRAACRVVWPKEAQTLVARVDASPRERSGSWQFPAEILSGPYAGHSIQVTLAANEKEQAAKEEKQAVDGKKQAVDGQSAPRPGDHIYINARVGEVHTAGNPGAFDYARFLRRQGISGRAYVAGNRWKARAMADAEVSLRLRMARYRQSLSAQYFSHLGSEEAGIAAAMSLGDKRSLDAAQRQSFSATGVSHVLALSGLHLGILFSLYSLLFVNRLRSRRGRVFASLLGVALLWGFALLVGFPLSLVRATVMFTLWQLSVVLYSERSSLNNLALAALLILLFSPASLFDIGFQLSFTSVFFILFLMPHVPRPRWLHRSRLLALLYGWLTVSIVAQIGTGPLVAYYFHTIPLVGLLGNLLAIPLAYVILGLALVFFLIPGFQGLTATLLGWCIRFLTGAVGWMSAWPYSHIKAYPHWAEVMVCYVLLLALLVYLIHRPPRVLYVIAGCLVLWTGIAGWQESEHRRQPRLMVYDSYAAPMVHLLRGKGAGRLLTTDSAKVASQVRFLDEGYWQPYGIQRPRMEVLAKTAPCLVVDVAGQRMAWVQGRLPAVVPASPESVSALLLSRGAVQPLREVGAFFRAEVIVLDGSLSLARREGYLEEAASLGIRVHDVRASGAFFLGD